MAMWLLQRFFFEKVLESCDILGEKNGNCHVYITTSNMSTHSRNIIFSNFFSSFYPILVKAYCGRLQTHLFQTIEKETMHVDCCYDSIRIPYIQKVDANIGQFLELTTNIYQLSFHVYTCIFVDS
jgi:hypothetical protein